MNVRTFYYLFSKCKNTLLDKNKRKFKTCINVTENLFSRSYSKNYNCAIMFYVIVGVQCNRRKIAKRGIQCSFSNELSAISTGMSGEFEMELWDKKILRKSTRRIKERRTRAISFLMSTSHFYSISNLWTFRLNVELLWTSMSIRIFFHTVTDGQACENRY